MSAILEVSTVVGCRLRCDYCAQRTHVTRFAQRGAEPDEFFLRVHDFKRCLETVPSSVEIMFAGMAEPWLNSGASEMVLHAHQKGHAVSTYTTAVGFKPADAHRLAHVPFVHFCLHLPDDAGQMKLQVDEDYLASLRAALPLAREKMVIGKLHPAVREVLGHDVVDGSAALISRAGSVPTMTPIARKTGALRCSATEPGTLNHNVLLPNGDVVICCCDYRVEHVFGNLLLQSYESLFQGDEYLRVMAGLAGDESIDIACRRCELSTPV